MLAIKMGMLPIRRLPPCLYSVNCINIVLNVRNQILLHTLNSYLFLEMMTLEIGLSEDPVSVTKLKTAYNSVSWEFSAPGFSGYLHTWHKSTCRNTQIQRLKINIFN